MEIIVSIKKKGNNILVISKVEYWFRKNNVVLVYIVWIVEYK